MNDEIIYDSEFVDFLSESKFNARKIAGHWRFLVECFPNELREDLQNNIVFEAEIIRAVKSGNGNFFRLLAKFIEAKKTPTPHPVRAWLVKMHMQSWKNGSSEHGVFTYSQLVEAAKAQNICKGMDDETILSTLKRHMKELFLTWKNSPQRKSSKSRTKPARGNMP